jgi:hypothetical protein
MRPNSAYPIKVCNIKERPWLRKTVSIRGVEDLMLSHGINIIYKILKGQLDISLINVS